MKASSLSLGAGSLFLLSLASPAIASDYELVETWQGEDFFDYFHFYTGKDPTKGWVTYVDQDSAESAGLVKITDKGTVYIGVDHTTTLSPSGKGRDSVRIGTTKYYEQSLVIADIAHMPGSVCGSWPAFWTVGRKWPEDGEIDIIEGVNLQDHNEIVMHTAGTCALTDQGMSGYVNATGCGEALGPVGCVVEGQQGSYGTSFNNQGGGVYALEWTEEFLKIWFFPRHAIPASITSDDPDTSEFGIPMALVQEGCDVANSFKAQSFVFDVTFCGDWAGGVFGDSGCPMTSTDSFQSCTNYVAQNPAKFKETYWEINSVKVYQTGVKATDSAPSHVSASHEVSLPVTHTHATKTATETHVNRPSDTSASVANRLTGESINSSDNASDAEDVILTLGYVHPISFAKSTFSKPTMEASIEQAPVATHAKPVTTRYVTEFVTDTTTICTSSESLSSHQVVKSAVSSTHVSQVSHASMFIHPASSVVLSAHSSNLPHVSETTRAVPAYASDVPHISETTHAASSYASDVPHVSETTHAASSYASDVPHVSETTHAAPAYASVVPHVSENSHAEPSAVPFDHASTASHASEITYDIPAEATHTPHSSKTTHAAATVVPSAHVSQTTPAAPTFDLEPQVGGGTSHEGAAGQKTTSKGLVSPYQAPGGADAALLNPTSPWAPVMTTPTTHHHHHKPTAGPGGDSVPATPLGSPQTSKPVIPKPSGSFLSPEHTLNPGLGGDSAPATPLGSPQTSKPVIPKPSGSFLSPEHTLNPGLGGDSAPATPLGSPQTSKPVIPKPSGSFLSPEHTLNPGLGGDSAPATPLGSPQTSKPVIPKPSGSFLSPEHTLNPGLGGDSAPATPLGSPQTSKPVIPKPSGSFLSPEHTLHPVPGASPSGASPFFTGAADRLSVKYSLIAAAIGFTFFA
ncbi:hypothetical protein N7520_005987 [Penicillium odoratum]|uniref:uncharacterized protein n=1 Tax=Penicillium odoratum TaxID=1167516 RepID=UPI002546AB8D|nr:uncharacterized protein N7520_005987 [Penicillium odoratum]KAJ5758831.1 hypothetical protein N7520_005987 [Penicillium odoratum]